MGRKAQIDIGTFPDLLDNFIAGLGPWCEGCIGNCQSYCSCCCPFCPADISSPFFVSQVIGGAVMGITSVLMFMASLVINPVTLISTMAIVSIILLLMFKLK